MRTIQQQFQVQFRYPVHFTVGLFDVSNALLSSTIAANQQGGPVKTLFVVDQYLNIHWPNLLSNIASYCGSHSDVIEQPMPPLIVPGGELVKNDPAYVEQVRSAIHEAGICRHSYVVAVGGGAVLDMVGYAAATAHRGVRLIRVPTTVLSQNDSGVGVKNGINAFGKKNFLGTFAPPCAVLNDSQFLTTLSDRDWRSGIAEAIKVALIKDPAFFEWLEEHAERLGVGFGLGSESRSPNPNPTPPCRDMEAMERLIHRCAELHLQHIATSGDPFEMG